MLLSRSIFYYITENAKFNISFMPKLCTSECIAVSAMHKYLVKCKQPVKQRAAQRDWQAFHFFSAGSEATFCLPVYSSASFSFRLFSKANWFNARLLDESILRWDVITLSWKSIFLSETRAGIEAFYCLSSFTNLSTHVIPSWKRNRKRGLLIPINISHHYWLYVNKDFCYSTSLLNWIAPR